ncbi:MAG: DUF5320 family protein [Candidatus Methanomethylicia archaeon]
MRWRYWHRYWPRGWWCPMHPWPPAWARIPYYFHPIDPSEELRMLEEERELMEKELEDIKRRIEEVKKLIGERK